MRAGGGDADEPMIDPVDGEKENEAAPPHAAPPLKVLT